MAATAASLRPAAVRPSRAARTAAPRRATAPRGDGTRPLRSVPAPTAPVARAASASPGGAVTRVIATIGSFVAVLGIVVVLQTLIAEQQLELDRTLTDVRLAQQHYDELRQTRAELRAPSHLIPQARMLGMMSGLGAKFQEVSPEAVARVMAATGNMDPLFLLPRSEPVVDPTDSAEAPMVAAGTAP
ncbi:MAG: hypothetical protein RL283_1218 [Actinomycetota bacterium]|jgi:hypothetical protein